MASNKVIGGDYEGYQIASYLGTIALSKGFNNITIGKQDIERVELMTEESKKKFLGAAGLGVAGGLLFGPVGLVAGALAGGNKKETCFACYLKNGKKFMAVTDAKTYQKIQAMSF